VALHVRLSPSQIVSLTLILLVLAFAGLLSAQTTVSTGSIVEVVSDPTSAVIIGAAVKITNATKQVINVQSNSSGSFNSGALIPGDYLLLVSAKGFSSAEASVRVLVGNTSAVNVKLKVWKRERNCRNPGLCPSGKH
jgi:hypothetical protein